VLYARRPHHDWGAKEELRDGKPFDSPY